jgi:hypothetical protein
VPRVSVVRGSRMRWPVGIREIAALQSGVGRALLEHRIAVQK